MKEKNEKIKIKMKKIQLVINQNNVDHNKKLEQLYFQGIINKENYETLKNSKNIQKETSEYYKFFSLKQVIISLALFVAILTMFILLIKVGNVHLKNGNEYTQICEMGSEYTDAVDCNKLFASESDINLLKALISNEIKMPLSNGELEKKITEIKINYKKIIGYTDEIVDKKYSAVKSENVEEKYDAFIKLYNADLSKEELKLKTQIDKANKLKIDVIEVDEDTIITKQKKYITAIKNAEAEAKAKAEEEAKAKAEAEAKVKTEANKQVTNSTQSNQISTNNSSSNKNNNASSANNTKSNTEIQKEEQPVNSNYCYPSYDAAYEAGLNVFLNGSFIDSKGIGKFTVDNNNCPVFYGTDGTYNINGQKI